VVMLLRKAEEASSRVVAEWRVSQAMPL